MASQLKRPSLARRGKWFQEFDVALAVDEAAVVEARDVGNWAGLVAGVEVYDFLGGEFER
jgi:hypothetical protein